MDLMGLEESVDFWDMGINDEGEILVPIKDLTKQSSFRHACPNPFCILITLSAGDDNSKAKKPNVKKANGKAAPKLLDALDSIGVAPKKLPNGNYECVCECFECKRVSGLLFLSQMQSSVQRLVSYCQYLILYLPISPRQNQVSALLVCLSEPLPCYQ
jgi:hypothetical protein